MKLIFKNENEENTFWAAAVYDKGVCPSHFGLHEDDSCLGPEPKRCFECWKNSGLETGVKSESDSTAEFKARLERLRKFIFMICGDDWSELIQEAYGQCTLTPEDVCFLCEIEEVDTAKGLIGYPEVFTADPDRTVKNKPPLGIMPRYLWERKRCREIAEAIDRYTYAEKLIPAEWIEEYNELVKKGADSRKEN